MLDVRGRESATVSFLRLVSSLASVVSKLGALFFLLGLSFSLT